MLTDHSAGRLIRFLKKLDKENIEWEIDYICYHNFIKVFNTEFRFSKLGIEKLAKYINTYNAMAKPVKSIPTEIREEMTVARRPPLDSKPSHDSYNAMVEEKLADIKEKFELQTKLIRGLFEVLKQKTEDLPNPDPSNSDDVSTVPPCPPPDVIDKGM